ncbi:MAG: bifunctional nuclease family protein [Elusimicrobia bacterium]|nr:bifunctional nuclease family protein [Elusimicrobiota bacterium]
MIEVKVLKVLFDFTTASAVVFLSDMEEKKTLPIWIGLFEAQAIQAALRGEVFSRPLTHDLLKNVIESSGGKLKHILIHKLEHNTYFSRIFVDRGGAIIDIDARPSDAICLALKSSAKIYVSREIYEKFEDILKMEEKMKQDFVSSFLKSIDKDDLKKA